MAGTLEIPGYIAGTWEIDSGHSEVAFSVRHMMVSKVRGRFGTFDGKFVTADDPTESWVTANIDVRSIDTNNAERDEHIRSTEYLAADKYPTMNFQSTEIRRDGDGFTLVGDLTLHGVTKQVSLSLEIGGFGQDTFGKTRAGFSAAGEINRRDFGIDVTLPMAGGGVAVGDRVSIELDIEGVLTT